MNDNLKDLIGSFNSKIDVLNNDLEYLKKISTSLIEKVNEEKELNQNIIKEFRRYETIESDIVKLNIGGCLFSTLKSTLTKIIKNKKGELYLPNIFESLLNGFVKPKYDENKAIFIDRNPKYFENILDYLRMANTDNEFEIKSEINQKELKKEAAFYNIQGLVELIELGIPQNEKIDSLILNETQFVELKNICGLEQNQKLELIYRGSRDGFAGENFHSNCDNISKTLTIVKSTGNHIFGGYTEQKWDSSGNYKNDPKAFIFSLNRKKKVPIYDANKAIYCVSDYGPAFGEGHDFYISDNSNTINSNYSNLNYSYKDSSLSSEAQSFLAGSYNFTVSEIEVFRLI